MTELFRSPRLQMQSARSHLKRFANLVDEFNCGDTYRLVEQKCADERFIVVKAKLNKPLPAEAQTIAADTIGALRPVLDQAVYAVARETFRQKKQDFSPTERVWIFPINKNESGVRSKIKELVDIGLPTEFEDPILSIEPFYSGDDIASPIFGLREASNTNKHRELVQVDIRLSDFTLRLREGPSTVLGPNIKEFHIGGGGHTVNAVPKDAPVSSDELGLYISRVEPRTIYETEAKIDFRFKSIKGIAQRSCIYQFEQMIDKCEYLLEIFESTSRKIGLVQDP